MLVVVVGIEAWRRLLWESFSELAIGFELLGSAALCITEGPGPTTRLTQ